MPTCVLKQRNDSNTDSNTQTVLRTPQHLSRAPMKWSCKVSLIADPGLSTSRRIALDPLQWPNIANISPRKVSLEPLCGTPRKTNPFVLSTIAWSNSSPEAALAFTIAWSSDQLVYPDKVWDTYLLHYEATEAVSDEDDWPRIVLNDMNTMKENLMHKRLSDTLRSLLRAWSRSSPWSARVLSSASALQALLWLNVMIRALRPAFGSESRSQWWSGPSSYTLLSFVLLQLQADAGFEASPWTARILNLLSVNVQDHGSCGIWLLDTRLFSLVPKYLERWRLIQSLLPREKRW